MLSQSLLGTHIFSGKPPHPKVNICLGTNLVESHIDNNNSTHRCARLTCIYLHYLSYLHFMAYFIHYGLLSSLDLGSSTTMAVSKRTQRNLLLTLSSSKRMGNSCGCTEQMFYKYFLGVSPPYGEGAILMVSNYLSCFVTLWLLGLILWERKYRKKSNNETPD